MRTQFLTLFSLLALSANAAPIDAESAFRELLGATAGGAVDGGRAGGPVDGQPGTAPVPSGAPVPAPSGAVTPTPSGGPIRGQQPAGSAAPVASGAPTASGTPTSSGGDFQIQIQNNCPDTKQFGIYQITSSFGVNAIGGTQSIPAGGSGTMNAPFTGIGMRLSGEAQDGTAGQWSAQTLFEFGYSEYAGQTGTAYDASVMGGSDGGVAIYPSNPACPTKVCTPSNCAASQGWTNPGQVNQGSPGDTVCYHGKTNFKVVWCP